MKVHKVGPHRTAPAYSSWKGGLGAIPCSSPRAHNRQDKIVWNYLVLSLLCLGACLPPAIGLPESAAVKSVHSIPTKMTEGRASHYGGKHNGRITSSGAVYNSSRMTAAHPTLPFGTRVTVTNLTNSRSCDVEITDRGPAHWTGRVIDPSEGAAKCLEMIRTGVVPVRMQ
jgi:rare lipoprotein A